MPTLLTPETCRVGSFIRYRKNDEIKYAIIRGRSPERVTDDGVKHLAMLLLESPDWALPGANALMGFSFEQLAGAEILTKSEALNELCQTAKLFAEVSEALEEEKKLREEIWQALRHAGGELYKLQQVVLLEKIGHPADGA
ncbi:MAG: hypothetical protein HYT37_00555 [Candidatus Sungbacteria bacterium]|nr:hypothetical protein [Candidatus Sungbacteria bacterium]